MVRKDILVKTVKGSFSGSIKSDLFTIPLAYPSSMYVIIDREVIYVGEIYASEKQNDGVYLSVVCDEQGRLVLIRYAFHQLPFLVKHQDVYCVEAFANVKDYEALSKETWDLGMTLSKVGKVVKI